MQDRYAGDVGDFVKLGLLRQVAAPIADGGAALSVGLNWYLAPEESHNADGKHIAYLHPSNRYHMSLAACDGPLIECLAEVVEAERSVEALDVSGALPTGSAAYSERLNAGVRDRGDWHGRALAALAHCDVVFADPDNGIRSTAARGKLHKYALVSELADYARRGQSLVVYHHADRSASAQVQAVRRLDELTNAVQQTPIGTLISRRGSCRFFLVTAAEPHAGRLTKVLATFASKWSPHVTLVRNRPEPDDPAWEPQPRD